MLVSTDAGTAARAGVVVYAAGLCSMLVASTTYHRWVHSLRWRARWRRADHAMIFMAIAGTATPLCLVVLPRTAAIVTLALLWSAAVFGAVIKLTRWRRGDRLATAMYVGNGWAGVVLVMARALTAARASSATADLRFPRIRAIVVLIAVSVMPLSVRPMTGRAHRDQWVLAPP